jgi:hypothetical protein
MDHLAQVEVVVPVDQVVHPVRQAVAALAVHQVPVEAVVLQAVLEQVEHQDLLVLLVVVEQVEVLVLVAVQVVPVQADLLVHQAHLAVVEHPVQAGLVEVLEAAVHQAVQEHLEAVGHQAHLVQVVVLVQVEVAEHQVVQALLDQAAQAEVVDQVVHQEVLVHLDLVVLV